MISNDYLKIPLLLGIVITYYIRNHFFDILYVRELTSITEMTDERACFTQAVAMKSLANRQAAAGRVGIGIPKFGVGSWKMLKPLQIQSTLKTKLWVSW
jgi:hypothetical protein